MLRLYHLLLGSILLVSIPVGAKFLLPQFSPPKVVKTPTVAKLPNSSQGNIWQKILGSAAAPTNWQVAPCEGNAPLLCISSKGKRLGTVEINIYPLANNEDFRKKLLAAGIPTASLVDYQSSKYQTQLLPVLKTWVAEHYAAFAKDRQGKYGKQITFSSYPPQPVPVGKLQGIRYGFAELNQQGGVQEQHIGHVAFDGTKLYVITTAFDTGTKTGKFDKLENLAIFQPYLYAIAADLHLPQ
ncbi:hypothetical protein [Nostoc sp. 'Peltigera malacea cyanobiont' DB3992]|uniref:hypothetical protein n=1 Tax=Nostoc sp. 'Peltigera malacea cyanobiont' DB3992 TaxID=1206980 RepID=UPI000C039F05|nr:hypothetical protein [Nostoc sp. 'Peltigera malacea cyanobiont' DB3992]PHM06605.1 hypothetical protein CK516_32455 [Nostoc sp. 'Peltigera malacea cyanobiont' DB3992]